MPSLLTTSILKSPITTDISGVSFQSTSHPYIAGYVIAVIVLASLCAVLGAIYGYIYFTRIHSRSGSRGLRFNKDSNAKDSHGSGPVSTHIFLVRNSRSVQSMRNT